MFKFDVSLLQPSRLLHSDTALSSPSAIRPATGRRKTVSKTVIFLQTPSAVSAEHGDSQSRKSFLWACHTTEDATPDSLPPQAFPGWGSGWCLDSRLASAFQAQLCLTSRALSFLDMCNRLHDSVHRTGSLTDKNRNSHYTHFWERVFCFVLFCFFHFIVELHLVQRFLPEESFGVWWRFLS